MASTSDNQKPADTPKTSAPVAQDTFFVPSVGVVKAASAEAAATKANKQSK
ncbi:MAG TPA: hypothetical protein VFH39_04180 [Candidatus Saccharimonadales bacterium]|nr:hypothetical protein [Candidatus Saccharimonadales bacterium]